MIINSLPDVNGSRCTLTFEQPSGWLRATWRGFIDPEEAIRGADNYLKHLADIRCPYLLNDNTALHGPWFDSLNWLLRIWVPQATRMGLRHVAHVVQADTRHDTRHDTITEAPRNPAACSFDLQLFDNVAEAEEWLRACQAKDAAATPQTASY